MNARCLAHCGVFFVVVNVHSLMPAADHAVCHHLFKDTCHIEHSILITFPCKSWFSTTARARKWMKLHVIALLIYSIYHLNCARSYSGAKYFDLLIFTYICTRTCLVYIVCAVVLLMVFGLKYLCGLLLRDISTQSICYVYIYIRVLVNYDHNRV